MARSKRGEAPPLEVQREFVSCRLEDQILIRTYEIVVPVVRKSVGTAVQKDRKRDAVAVRVAQGA